MKQILILFLAFSITACGLTGKSKKVTEAPEPTKLESIQKLVDIKKLWSTDIGSGFDSYAYSLVPAITDGVAYAANSNGKVIAIDSVTGKKRWSVNIDKEISGGVGLGDGLIYVGTVEAEVIALDVRDGKTVWQQRVPSEVLVTPVAAAGRVIVQTIDGKVTGLSSIDGKVKWTYQHVVPNLTLRGGATPVLGVGVVICAFSDGQVVALDTAGGRVLWNSVAAYATGRNEVERLTDIDTQPVLKKDILYTASYQGQIIAAAFGSRKLVWTKRSSTNRNLAVTEDSLFYTSSDGVITAIDRHTGETKWTQSNLQYRELTAPVVLKDWLVVGERDDYMHVINQSNGKLLGRKKLSGGLLIDPINFNDRLYTLSGSGALSAWAVTH